MLKRAAKHLIIIAFILYRSVLGGKQYGPQLKIYK